MTVLDKGIARDMSPKKKGFFRSLGQAFFTQEINCFFHIAFGIVCRSFIVVIFVWIYEPKFGKIAHSESLVVEPVRCPRRPHIIIKKADKRDKDKAPDNYHHYKRNIRFFIFTVACRHFSLSFSFA